jgi:hypothetical protein
LYLKIVRIVGKFSLRDNVSRYFMPPPSYVQLNRVGLILQLHKVNAQDDGLTNRVA